MGWDLNFGTSLGKDWLVQHGCSAVPSGNVKPDDVKAWLIHVGDPSMINGPGASPTSGVDMTRSAGENMFPSGKHGWLIKPLCRSMSFPAPFPIKESILPICKTPVLQAFHDTLLGLRSWTPMRCCERVASPPQKSPWRTTMETFADAPATEIWFRPGWNLWKNLDSED